jgi:hypothetical protein
MRLPISERGPVDFWELARLAARFLSETPLPGWPLSGCGIWGPESSIKVSEVIYSSISLLGTEL